MRAEGDVPCRVLASISRDIKSHPPPWDSGTTFAGPSQRIDLVPWQDGKVEPKNLISALFEQSFVSLVSYVRRVSVARAIGATPMPGEPQYSPPLPLDTVNLQEPARCCIRSGTEEAQGWKHKEFLFTTLYLSSYECTPMNNPRFHHSNAAIQVTKHSIFPHQ